MTVVGVPPPATPSPGTRGLGCAGGRRARRGGEQRRPDLGMHDGGGSAAVGKAEPRNARAVLRLGVEIDAPPAATEGIGSVGGGRPAPAKADARKARAVLRLGVEIDAPPEATDVIGSFASGRPGATWKILRA